MLTPEEKKKHTRRTILLAGLSFGIGAIVNNKIRDETLKEGYLIFDNITATEIMLESLVERYKIKRTAIVDLPIGEINYQKIRESSAEEEQIVNQFQTAWSEYNTYLETASGGKPKFPPQSFWPDSVKEYYRDQQPVIEALERYARGDFTFRPLSVARRALALGLEVYGVETPPWQPFVMNRTAFAQEFQQAKEKTIAIDLTVAEEYATLKELLILQMQALTQSVERNGLLDVPEPPALEERIPNWIDLTKNKTPLLLCVYGGATNALIEYLNEQSITVRHECCETTARKV